MAERRGVPANAVAAKAQLYKAAGYRNLLFFLQGLSMKMGGLPAVAEELFDAFPDRVRDDYDTAALPPNQRQEACALMLRPEQYEQSSRWFAIRWFTEFLERFCVDPAIDLRQIIDTKFAADAPYFADPVGALLEYRRRFEAAQDFKVITSIGREVHQILDRVLSTRRMSIIEAPSGSGKTYSAEQWCHRHLGEARFVSLSGITHRTGLFQKIAAALGLSTCQQASAKLQAKIEAHLDRTKLMLVFDEAHFLWPQHRRYSGPPELIDWVDTALVNNGVPVAHIATDQFARGKAQAETTGWTSDQFMHRTWRHHLVKAKLTIQDLRKVAAVLLAHRWIEDDAEWAFDHDAEADTEAVEAVALYGKNNHLPLAAIRSIVDEARAIAREEHDADAVDLIHVDRAIESQLESDETIRTIDRRFKKPPGRAGASARLILRSVPRRKEQMSNNGDRTPGAIEPELAIAR